MAAASVGLGLIDKPRAAHTCSSRAGRCGAGKERLGLERGVFKEPFLSTQSGEFLLQHIAIQQRAGPYPQPTIFKGLSFLRVKGSGGASGAGPRRGSLQVSLSIRPAALHLAASPGASEKVSKEVEVINSKALRSADAVIKGSK